MCLVLLPGNVPLVRILDNHLPLLARELLDIEVASRKPTEDATANWTKLRIEVVGSQISIYANGNLYIVKNDTTFGGKGYIYLQAYQATASIKNINIYEIS